jgi:hypothetical protein
MLDFRILATKSFLGGLTKFPVFTIQKTDHTAEGLWSKPEVPLLIFRNHTLAGTTLSFHGGALAGAPGGHALQLVFWGDWWNGPDGSQRRSLLEERTKALVQSVYFSELAQYGVAHAPVWRGSTTVTRPAPPASVSNYNDITYKVLDLIGALIDDDVFPDPDDGARILFLVAMPDGFTIADRSALGAHWKDYDNDFPWLDADHYWAGWANPLPIDPTPSATDQSAMSVLSHETVEMMTDPEGTGWHTESTAAANEISDAGFSPTAAQTAFVNGVHVQAYWSNRHGATVIPIDRDYAARLRADVSEKSRRVLGSGTFRPDAADNAACSPTLPECCFEDRDYAWRLYGVDEVATVKVQTARYRTPVIDWTIGGQAVTGEGDLVLSLDVEAYAGRSSSVTNRPVTLHYVATAASLDVSSPGANGNFEVTVGCSVRDGSITGDLKVDVIATPQISVGIIGTEVLLEDAYIKQKSACLTAMVKRYYHQYKPTGKIRREDGINFDPVDLLRDAPAYVRPSQYDRLRRIGKAARAAQVLLEPGMARGVVKTLVSEARALSRHADFKIEDPLPDRSQFR